MSHYVASAHPAFQLIKRRQAEFIAVGNYDCVCPRQIDTVFDNSRGDQNVVIAVVKFHHAVFQRFSIHLSVRDYYFRFGNDRL